MNENKRDEKFSFSERIRVASKMEIFLIATIIILVFAVFCLLIDLYKANELIDFLIDGYLESTLNGFEGSIPPKIDGDILFPGWTLL